MDSIGMQVLTVFCTDRAVLIDTLAALLPPQAHSHFRKRCTSVTAAPDGRAEVRFADGSTHVADIVIGADGIKSAIRGLGMGIVDCGVSIGQY